MITCLHLHVSFPRIFRCFATANTAKTWRVSSLGRVCSLYGVVSHGYLHPSGYRIVQILGQFWKVHRVVMITFNGPPKSSEAWQVHHLDGDPGNNCLENLEYVTQGQNTQYSYASLSRKCSGPARSKPVMFRPTLSTEWTACPSGRAAAHLLGISSSTVSRACHTMTPACGDFFRFQDAEALPTEEWRPMVDPFSGALVGGRKVSSLGRITSCSGVIGVGCLKRIGYHGTSISVHGQTRDVNVHQLVAAAFVGPPPSGPCIHVNHKDTNKANNAASNLEYVTAAENAAHFLANSSETKKPRSTCKPVWSRPLGSDEPWKWHESATSAERELGLSRGHVSNCVNGKARFAGKYECKFAEVPESHPLPGEEWRDVDIHALQRDRWSRLWEDSSFLIRAVRWCLPGVYSPDHPFGKVSEGYSFRSRKHSERGSRVESRKRLGGGKNRIFRNLPKSAQCGFSPRPHVWQSQWRA